MDWIPLNFALLRNPYNWVIVILMLLVAGLALAYVFPQNSATEGN